MDSTRRDVLIQSCVLFHKSLDLHSLDTPLISAGVLSGHVFKDIYSLKPSRQILEFVDQLLRRPSDDFNTFVQVLKETKFGHVADTLEKLLEEKKMNHAEVSAMKNNTYGKYKDAINNNRLELVHGINICSGLMEFLVTNGVIAWETSRNILGVSDTNGDKIASAILSELDRLSDQKIRLFVEGLKYCGMKFLAEVIEKDLK